MSQKTEQVSEDQSGGKVSFHTKEPTDQLKITVLSSEQMKELFPEQDEPRDADTLQHHEVDKSEPPKKKCVTEVESQCDPLIPPEEKIQIVQRTRTKSIAVLWAGLQ